MTSTINRLWKNEYFQTAVMIGLIVIIFFGFWYGSRAVLNTEYPMLAVASGSMCTLPGDYCDGWSHPFVRTLHTGDLIVVQGVDPEDIYAAKLNTSGRSGDIIVFREGGTLIVHRAIAKRVVADRLEFQQQGDGNEPPGATSNWISEDQVVGRVIMRIPWIGHLALLMQKSTGLYLIIALIIILVVIELLVPVFRGKKTENVQRQGGQGVEDATNNGTEPSTTP